MVAYCLLLIVRLLGTLENDIHTEVLSIKRALEKDSLMPIYGSLSRWAIWTWAVGNTHWAVHLFAHRYATMYIFTYIYREREEEMDM